MAKQRAPKTDLVTKPNNIIPFGDMPDYLKDTSSDKIGNLGEGDFKVPRIMMLQALSPEVKTYQGEAIPGEFWHNSAAKSLGSEFIFIPVIVNKRVILWRPRHEGGGMLAFSRDAVNWDMGANQTFNVTLKKGDKNAVKWQTGKNVPTSGLVDWGSSNPDEENSQPAATLTYEYLCYLPNNPELSPCLFGVSKTGLPNGKQLNTSLFMLRKPTASVAVRVWATEQSSGSDTWFVPQFKTAGFVSKEVYEITSKLAEQHKDYKAEYTQDEVPASDKDDGKY